MEGLIAKFLVCILETNNLLSDYQFVFHCNRSVSDQLLLTNNMVTLNYDRGSTVELMLFDTEKAFNKIHLEWLGEKLSLIGHPN